MPRPPLEDFLDRGRVYVVRGSSHVRRISWDDEDEMLYVTYKGGAAYVFLHISELEARSLWFSASPGKWLWTNIRVRGSKTAHRKSYYRLD